MNDEGLQTRREFFKKATKSILPIVGFITLGPMTFSSCEKEIGSCNDCSNGCATNCDYSCSGVASSSSCRSCSSSCSGSCHSSCENSSVITAGNGTSESPYNVAQAIELVGTTSPTDHVYIRGKIARAVNYLLGKKRTFYISDDGNYNSSKLRITDCANIGNVDFEDGYETNDGDELIVYGYLKKVGSTLYFKDAYVYQWLRKNRLMDFAISDADGTIDGHEYVDLGLSVKWARININATRPEKYGSYLTANVDDSLINNGFWGECNLCGTSQDIARHKWGSKWKLPSKEQLDELVNTCNIEKGKYNGVVGVKLTSRINNKSIFLPAGGYKMRLNNRWDDPMLEVSCLMPSGTIGVYSTSADVWALSMNIYNTVEYTIKKHYLYEYQFTIRPVTTGSSSGGGTLCDGNCTGTVTSATCSNCSSSCSTSCGTECSSNCGAACSGGCSGGCSDECLGGCGSTCIDTCRGNCGVGCSGSCDTSCYHSCNTECYGTCRGGCNTTCVGSCSGWMNY